MIKTINKNDLYVISYVPSAVKGIEVGTVVRFASEPLKQGGVTKAKLDYVNEDRQIEIDVDYLTPLEEWEKEQSQTDPILQQVTNLEVVQKDPRSLTPHPINCQIYGKDEPIDDLLVRVKETGIIHPLIVNQDGEIIHGNRRREVAIKLGWHTVPGIVQKFENKIQELEALLSHNASRQKTNAQLMAEIDYWRLIESERAKLRQQSGVKVAAEEKGTVTQKVSQITGVSEPTIRRGSVPWNAIKEEREQGNHEEAKRIEQEMNKSFSAGERYVKQKKEKEAKVKSEHLKQKIELQTELGFPCETGDLCLIKAKKDKDLKVYNGLWGSVIEVNNAIGTVKVYNSLLVLKPENVERINCDEKQKQSGFELMQKLHEIGTRSPEDITLAILLSLSKRNVFSLSDLEAEIIELISKHYLKVLTT